MKAIGSVKRRVAKVPRISVPGLVSAEKASGVARAPIRIKNRAAAIVAVKMGKSLSLNPPEPDLISSLVK
jgi:hypothetical protein